MTCIYKIERRSAGLNRPDYFVCRTERRPWLKVFGADDVPPFEGAAAYFEVETLPGRPVRFIRQLAESERPL